MLAKIGGGELAPMTTLGRIIAAITVMLGIGCFALPVAIIGRGFYEEIRRRDFVVTFAMVARVPLFARLDAAAIADLVGMLRARTVPAGATIIRKGERGDAMYLIASGRVEVESAAAGSAGGGRFLRRDVVAVARAALRHRDRRAPHRPAGARRRRFPPPRRPPPRHRRQGAYRRQGAQARPLAGAGRCIRRQPYCAENERHHGAIRLRLLRPTPSGSLAAP